MGGQRYSKVHLHRSYALLRSIILFATRHQFCAWRPLQIIIKWLVALLLLLLVPWYDLDVELWEWRFTRFAMSSERMHSVRETVLRRMLFLERQASMIMVLLLLRWWSSFDILHLWDPSRAMMSSRCSKFGSIIKPACDCIYKRSIWPIVIVENVFAMNLKQGLDSLIMVINRPRISSSHWRISTLVVLAILFGTCKWFIVIVMYRLWAHMLTLGTMTVDGRYLVLVIWFNFIVVFVNLLVFSHLIPNVIVMTGHFGHLEYDLALFIQLHIVLRQALHKRFARRGGRGWVLVLRLFYFLADKDYWWSLRHRWRGVGTAYLFYAFVLRSRLLRLLTNSLFLFPFFDHLLIINLVD